MKVKLVSIIIIVLNVIFILFPKDTYVYYPATMRVDRYDVFQTAYDFYCYMDKENIAILSDGFHLYDDRDSYEDSRTTDYYYLCWEFEALSEGTTDVELYYYERNSEIVRNNFENAIAVDTITLEVDRYGNFVIDLTWDYITNVYRENVYIICICFFVIIATEIHKRIRNSYKQNILNALMIVSDILLILYALYFNIQGTVILLFIPYTIINVVFWLYNLLSKKCTIRRNIIRILLGGMLFLAVGIMTHFYIPRMMKWLFFMIMVYVLVYVLDSVRTTNE